MLKSIAAVIIFSIFALAQPPETPKIGQIPPAHRAIYWKANTQVLAAQIQLDRAQKILQASEAILAKDCGDQQLASGPDGEPVCQPKAPESKAESTDK
jgi:hypothetical protein